MRSRKFRPVLFFVGTGVMVFREFSFFLEPRFWGEEGVFYFKHAYVFSKSPSWFMGLLNFPSGYVDLWASLAATIAANLVPLNHAPLATALAPFAVQVVSLAAILWTRSDLWNTPGRTILAFLIILFAPASGEVFLNTTNSQWYFGLTTFLILLAGANGGRFQRYASRVLLALGGLTGLISCLLTPFFLWKTRQEKSRERTIQTLILSACSAIQVLVMISSSGRGKASFLEFFSLNAATVVSILLVRSVGLVLTGAGAMKGFSGLLSNAAAKDALLFALLCFGLTAAMAGLFAFLGVKMKRPEQLFWVGAYLLVIVLSIAGSRPRNKAVLAYPGIGERYFFIPNLILMLFILRSFLLATGNKVRKAILAVILTASVVAGVVSYRRTVISNPAWPKWKEQVSLWRKNPGRNLEIWPPGWNLSLEKKRAASPSPKTL